LHGLRMGSLFQRSWVLVRRCSGNVVALKNRFVHR
jgi:hypothetical protein